MSTWCNGDFSSLDISPEKVVSVTSNGASSMVRHKDWFISLRRKQKIHWFNFIASKGSLCQRSKKLDDVLKDVTNLVNFIMVHALNFWQFQVLLVEVQAQYNTLLMYKNVSWLSIGQVLESLIACLEAVRLFLNEKWEDYLQFTHRPGLASSCSLQILLIILLY